MSEQVTTSFELPAHIQVRGVDGKPTSVNTQTWESDFIQYMLAYAWGVRMQRATASAKDKDKALRDMFSSMCKGEVGNADGSGRGATLMDEDQAFLDMLNDGRKEKIAIKDYIRHAVQYARERITAAYVAQGMDPKVEAQKIALKAEASWEIIRDKVLSTPEGQIALERVKAMRAKVNTSKVTIDLSDIL